ncbi:CDP-alcohol phosphatidyltransferase family protein [Pseudidiomarina sp.]|uniref:CDP-alcohol phosphatidyltransferase family protein n=1 Tax=Pseudidiomarina sp. TaxID=2081707 RepID=UPI00299F4262|nr:CDP-alcohol phosphatidyltransferase family protein [Pseudidiomarina sp.]MDX1705498.1 CDP-alcohol phosphatidyltransferase family protein [Pseudidiomarina sp.]
MLDPILSRTIRPIVKATAGPLVKAGITADQVTITGFLIGILAVPALAYGQYELALVLILINRISDGLDGAVARLTQTSDAGGYLDISLDFIFYSAVPFGFLLADIQQNAIAAGFLMLTFMGTGATFLAFAVLANKRGIVNPNYPNKSLHYMGGLTEGFETIAAFVIFCLWPQWFWFTALLFAGLCWLTALTRLWAGYRTLQTNLTLDPGKE